MTFKSKAEERKFGVRETRVVSKRIPANKYESIKTALDEFADSFSEDNIKRIKTVQDGIKEMISLNQDVHDYIKKERSITESKYLEILDNHNIDLINDVIAEFPIERKPPIKTLTEEKREEALREKELRIETPSTYNKGIDHISSYNKGIDHISSYNKEVDYTKLKNRKYQKKLTKSIHKSMRGKH